MNQPEKNASDQPLPGSVSNQNAEEAEPGHGDGSAGAQSPSGGSPGRDEKSESGGQSGGESGEGSQSTGNPDSAG